MIRPIQIFYNKKYAHLCLLADEYTREGYGVLLNGFEGVLKIYDRGVPVPTEPKSMDQLEYEKRIKGNDHA